MQDFLLSVIACLLGVMVVPVSVVSLRIWNHEQRITKIETACNYQHHRRITDPID